MLIPKTTSIAISKGNHDDCSWYAYKNKLGLDSIVSPELWYSYVVNPIRVQYPINIDEITKAWSGMSTRKYKNLKGLTKENLRDNMSDLELVPNILAEATTTELSKVHNPQGFEENREVAKRGGKYAGNARKEIEADTARSVIASKNATELNQVITDLIESVADEKR